MNDLIYFIGGGSILASLVIGVFKKIIKEHISSRFGDLGIVAFLAVISLIISLVYWGWTFLPAEVIATAIMIMSGAVSIFNVLYQIIYQKAIKGKLDKDEIA